MEHRGSISEMGSRREYLMKSVVTNILGEGFVPEKTTMAELQASVAKLKEQANVLRLENKAIRFYIAGRKPQELQKVDDKKAMFLRNMSNLFYGSGAPLPTPVETKEDFTYMPEEDERSVVSMSSIQSAASSAAMDIGSLMAAARLSTADKIKMVRSATMATRKRLEKKLAENQARRRKLRHETIQADELVGDLKEAIASYQELQYGEFTVAKMKYTLGRMVRSNDNKLQQLVLDRTSMRPKKTEIERRMLRWKELAKELHKVDWDMERMKLETQQKVLDEKTKQWLSTQRQVAHIGLDVHELQRKTRPLVEQVRKSQQVVAMTQNRAKSILNELPHVKRQVAKEEHRMTHMKSFLEKYEAPDVVDYIRACKKLSLRERQIAFYKRNIPIRKVTLFNAIKMLIGLDQECHARSQESMVSYRMSDDIREIIRRTVVKKTCKDFEIQSSASTHSIDKVTKLKSDAYSSNSLDFEPDLQDLQDYVSDYLRQPGRRSGSFRGLGASISVSGLKVASGELVWTTKKSTSDIAEEKQPSFGMDVRQLL